MEDRRLQSRIYVTGKMLYDDKPAKMVDMNISALKFSCQELLPVGALLDVAIDINEPAKKVVGRIIRSVKLDENSYESVIIFTE